MVLPKLLKDQQDCAFCSLQASSPWSCSKLRLPQLQWKVCTEVGLMNLCASSCHRPPRVLRVWPCLWMLRARNRGPASTCLLILIDLPCRSAGIAELQAKEAGKMKQADLPDMNAITAVEDERIQHLQLAGSEDCSRYRASM